MLVQVGGQEICLSNVEGEYLAIGNICTHDGAPLNEGTLEVDEVECPWHGSRFDVRTGEPVMAPATEGVRVHPVRVDGDDIWVGAR